MVQGTHSDAGKSLLVTALCRIFTEKGCKTAPFKSQNMALNSYITPDGKEIGRAQGVQAEAAGIAAHTDMNPILIKPEGESRSQIVVHGKPYKTMQAGEYRQDFYEKGLELIRGSYASLAGQYDRVVIEGAGSPAEVNLNDREIVNMRVAREVNAPVILVGDIDKGGVFASLVGTLQLLDPEDRKRIIGVVINKFRGDLSLLQPGLDWFETYSGVPVLGVIPHIDGLAIEAEDSLALSQFSTVKNHAKELDIAVIHYPRLSNFTDADPLALEPDCHVRLVKTAEELGAPDLILLPGSKNTLEDLQTMKASGLADVIRTLAETGEAVVMGICGGYQMLGEKLDDPSGIESEAIGAEGMGLIPVLTTTLTDVKQTVLTEGKAHYNGRNIAVKGYEIHMGRSSMEKGWQGRPFIELADGSVDGFINDDETVMGTYFHGIFENDQFRECVLNDLRHRKGLAQITGRTSFQSVKEESFEKLAGVVRERLDMDRIEAEMAFFQKKM